MTNQICHDDKWFNIYVYMYILDKSTTIKAIGLEQRGQQHIQQVRQRLYANIKYSN